MSATSPDLTSRSAPSGPVELLRRTGCHASTLLVAVAFLAAVCAACTSSSKATPPGATRDVSGGGSSSADVSALAGTWMSVDGNQLLFCKVGTVVRTGAAPTTTGSASCDYPLAWNAVNRLDVRADGQVLLSFVHPKLAGAEIQGSNRTTPLATCRATASSDGRRLQFDNLVCKMSAHDGSTIDSSGLADPTWKLDGSCLSIEGVWFGQKRGECDQHRAKKVFTAPGHAIANAS